jgi:hypothetical protein
LIASLQVLPPHFAEKVLCVSEGSVKRFNQRVVDLPSQANEIKRIEDGS